MRKVFILVIAVLMAISLPATVSASGLGYSEGEVEITYHAFSVYTVTIPDSFDGESCQISISDAELEDNYQVIVSVTNLADNNCIELHKSNDASVIKYLSLTGSSATESWSVNQDDTRLCVFAHNDLDEGAASRCFSAMPVGDRWTPGDYEGVLCYRIECVYVRPIGG